MKKMIKSRRKYCGKYEFKKNNIETKTNYNKWKIVIADDEEDV
jgi:hypothetical protein